MSWELIGRWIAVAVKLYLIYFAVVFTLVGAVLLIYIVAERRHERREHDRDD